MKLPEGEVADLVGGQMTLFVLYFDDIKGVFQQLRKTGKCSFFQSIKSECYFMTVIWRQAPEDFA